VAKHHVTNDDVSLRIFRSGLLEALTKVHPAAPHLIFLPTIAWRVLLSADTGLAAAQQVGAFLGGILAWTLAEYLVHRFVFHAAEQIEVDARNVLIDLPPGEPGDTWGRPGGSGSPTPHFALDSRALACPCLVAGIARVPGSRLRVREPAPALSRHHGDPSTPSCVIGARAGTSSDCSNAFPGRTHEDLPRRA
jgi:hypothetical protein